MDLVPHDRGVWGFWRAVKVLTELMLFWCCACLLNKGKRVQGRPYCRFRYAANAVDFDFRSTVERMLVFIRYANCVIVCIGHINWILSHCLWKANFYFCEILKNFGMWNKFHPLPIVTIN
jgi:hypothetical protein